MPFTFEPTATGQFIRHGTATQLSPPTVGAFLPATNPAIALAGTLAAWLELHPRRVALAPPLLYTAGRWRVAELGLDWLLPPDTAAAPCAALQTSALCQTGHSDKPRPAPESRAATSARFSR